MDKNVRTRRIENVYCTNKEGRMRGVRTGRIKDVRPGQIEDLRTGLIENEPTK